MKKMRNKLNLLLCTMLVTSMMFVTYGCGGNQTESDNSNGAEASTQVSTEVVADTEMVADTESVAVAEVTVLGEGENVFAFTVVDKDGNETVFEIHTDKETVGEALLELELIAGEDGDYGLYVKEVNGITADYDTDGTYWAFYVNGEYATAGVDQTTITEGDSYSFKVEK